MALLGSPGSPGHPDSILTPARARAVRDRAASMVHAEPGRALDLAHAALRAARNRPAADARDQAEILAHLHRASAEAEMFSGKLPAAHAAYLDATAAAEAAGAKGLLGEILVGRVHHLSLMGARDEAGRVGRRAERILRAENGLVYLGKLYLNRGNSHYQRDEYREAAREYARAAAVFERLGVRDATWVVLLMNRGIVATNLSRLGEARTLFRLCARECARQGLDLVCAQVRYNLAFLEAGRGDFRLALRLLEQAEELFQQEEIADMTAAAQRARAEIYLDLGMAREAGELARTATAGFAELGMILDANLARIDQARACMLEGRPVQAVPLLTEAAAFFSGRAGRPRRAAILLEMARARLQAGDFSTAATLARDADRLFRALPAPRGRSEACRAQAEADLGRGRIREAGRRLAPALSILRTQPLGEQADLLALAGRIARAAGRPALAASRWRRATEALELQRHLIPGVELRARAFERQARLYRARLAMELDAPRPRMPILFGLVASARARAFLERIDESGSRAGERLTDERATLGSLVRRLEAAEMPDEGTPDPARVEPLREEVRRFEQRLVARFRRSDGSPVRPTRRRRPPRQPGAVDPRSLASLLRPDETLIEYFVVDERILALLTGPGGATWRVLPEPLASLRAQIARVQFQLDAAAALAPGQGGNLDFRRRAAEDALGRLHATVLAPLADLLPAEGRLLVVPHSILHRVPFECLWTGDGYLHERFVLSRCPAPAFLGRRRSRHVRRSSRTVLAGQISGGPPFVDREITRLSSFFAPSRLKVIRDPGTSAILTAMERCRVLHLSTHGVYRDDNPLFSRLATADGALFVADLFGRRLDAELVVLSACNSGRVFAGEGDDLEGVAHGFLAAGAAHLVASLWRVHDEATLALMESFYRHYTRDARHDPALALSLAAREVRGVWDHPFFWGGFCVQGS